MDFDLAAKRLERDQTKLRGRRGPNRGAPPALSARAREEAARRRKQQQELAEGRARRQRHTEAMEAYLHQCERNLGVKHLSKSGSLQLTATSIHGEGDKIALPPSVLETLTQSVMGNDDNSRQEQQPWTFRVGILNPTYSFPASSLMQSLPVEESDQPDDDDNDDDEEEDDNSVSKTAAYLDELKHKYRAYTHATVVEFTQEEGHVGLPEPVARALLRQASELETMRTVDKASAAAASDDGTAAAMEVVDDDEKTPGHLAWGAFDVPVDDIEITMVHLPKGRTAKLLPSEEAIRNGFYNLKDIKMVLEQSLIRTRATLSVGDLIHTWHRGTKFDLTVTRVTPAAYGSVSCINTDIEIDFEAAETLRENNSSATTTNASAPSSSGIPLGGRRLGEASTSAAATASSVPSPSLTANIPVTQMQQQLVPEPPADQKEGVVTVQIRSMAAKGQRRFDIQTATVRDLFAFAASLLGTDAAAGGGAFCLVTRFPRRVLRLDNGGAAQTLQQAGIAAGQELFMVEPL